MKFKRDRKLKKDNATFNETVNPYASDTLANAKNPTYKNHDEEYAKELSPDDFE